MRRRSLTRDTAPKPQASSRITNGRDMLANVDGRTFIARRYRDLCRAIFADQGGQDRLSETRQQLIRRFAALAVQAEEMEARLARGEIVDLADQCLIGSTLVRLATRIGIDRRTRNIVPDLADYIEGRAAATEAAE